MIAELQNSKAKLVDDITKHIAAGYDKQIESLKTTLMTHEKTSQKEVDILTNQLQGAKNEKVLYDKKIQELQKQIEKKGSISALIILLIIAALIIGLLVGRLFM